MSYDISGNIQCKITLANTRVLDITSVIDSLGINDSRSIAYGTGANQINIVYHDTVTLADGANDTINLYDSGTLKDSFGNALTLESLKFLYVKNNSADADLLLFGGSSADLPICSSNTDQIIIKPGGVFVWYDMSAAGTVITTNKNLRIEHNGTGTSTMDVDFAVGGLD